FQTSTENLLAAEAGAGVKHHVALSVVGTDRMPDSGYIRAKLAQENLIKQSPIPYSIVHSTQFFEFAKSIADSATDNGTARVSTMLIQPMAAEEVADAVAKVAAGPPVNGTLEIGGPEAMQLDEFVRRRLRASGDTRSVVGDPNARYFGAKLDERTLLPGDSATLGKMRFDEWLSRQTPAS
ncbi:MAG TPA: 3-beta hydroxysteroid dehydrogenase, partial [Gemmatimonadaceae bacterium]